MGRGMVRNDKEFGIGIIKRDIIIFPFTQWYG